MRIVPYTDIPAYHRLSSCGRGRADLFMLELEEGTTTLPDNIDVGMKVGFLLSGNSYYTIRGIKKTRSLDDVNLSKMDRSGCFLVVVRVKDDIINVIELFLITE